MKVAGVQFDIAWESPTENFARLEPLIATAAAAGCRLVVLPEMFATGFSMAAERVAAFAGVTRAFMTETARRHGLWILGGFAEVGPGRPRNAACLMAPDGGERLLYHKIHPFSLAKEHENYDGGTSAAVVDVEGVRVAPFVCYDLRFPEPFRALASRTDLFCVIANWPASRRHAWRTLLQARAIENQAFVLGVNRVGMGDGLLYSGDSALVDPLGEAVCGTPEQPGLVTGEVDPQAVAAVRARLTFLADRRPEVYRGL